MFVKLGAATETAKKIETAATAYPTVASQNEVVTCRCIF
jgi:hypothetical protein